MKITIWKRYHPKKCNFVHNHIEDGMNLNVSPTPKSEMQQVWYSWTWQKQYGTLINGKVNELSLQ